MYRFTPMSTPKPGDIEITTPLDVAWYAQAQRRYWHQKQSHDDSAMRAYAIGAQRALSDLLGAILGTRDEDEVIAKLREGGLEPF